MHNREIHHQEIITSPERYWNDPRVAHAVLNFLGGDGYSWDNVGSVEHQYLGVAYEEKAFSGRKSPVSTLCPSEFPSMIQKYHGRMELTASYLHRESSEQGVPERILFCWDLDRFRFHKDNNYDEGSLIVNADQTFESLDSTYYLFREFFQRYNVPILSVMSGKGIHLFTQVSDPEVIKSIQQIGSVIEPTIQGKLEHAHRWSKAPGPIPLFHEQGFKGTVRLQQWVSSLLIREARRRTSLSVEIWDKGNPNEGTDGIALDNTAAIFAVNNKSIGALGSPYFIKALRSGISLERMLLQLPLSGNGYDNNWRNIMTKRYSFTQSADYLGNVDCTIPDGSNGMKGLIRRYESSDLKSLHTEMDMSMGDDPSMFDFGYRNHNYDGIISRTQEPDVVRNTLTHANPMLLQNRFFLDHFIFQTFRAMGGNKSNLSPAPHVAGLLRAIYEDPRFKWGDTWMRHQDALRWARGSVEQALGQMFESEYPY